MKPLIYLWEKRRLFWINGLNQKVVLWESTVGKYILLLNDSNHIMIMSYPGVGLPTFEIFKQIPWGEENEEQILYQKYNFATSSKPHSFRFKKSVHLCRHAQILKENSVNKGFFCVFSSWVCSQRALRFPGRTLVGNYESMGIFRL